MSNVAATVSRRAYCQQFQSLLNRVRSAAKIQRSQKERILGLADFKQDRLFPLPGKTGLSESLRTVATAAGVAGQKEPVIYEIKFPTYDTKTAQFFSSLNDRDNRLFTALLNMSDSKSIPSKPPRTPGVRVASDKVECIVQECSPKLTKNFAELFPGGIPSAPSGTLSAVIISHNTENDMSVWSAEMDVERENLTDEFVKIAMEIVQALKENGVWADFIDPSSGRPYYSPYTNATFFDTDDRYKEFGFVIQDLGCCKCLEHPVWGVKAFVGMILTTGSTSHPILKEIIQSKSE